MARRELTGVLLVGGASRRFGSPKALAELDGETLAARAWRTLGEACDERLAVGKAADALELPFPLVDDGSDARAASTKPAMCRSVNASIASGSSQGSQSSSARVKTAGTV